MSEEVREEADLGTVIRMLHSCFTERETSPERSHLPRAHSPLVGELGFTLIFGRVPQD